MKQCEKEPSCNTITIKSDSRYRAALEVIPGSEDDVGVLPVEVVEGSGKVDTNNGVSEGGGARAGLDNVDILTAVRLTEWKNNRGY